MVKEKHLSIFFLLFFGLLNVAFWKPSHHLQKDWQNVPLAPSRASVSMMTLGDGQLAYRAYVTMLQNIGGVDGRIIALKDYNFEMLKKWFFLLDYLDPVSNSLPMLVAYYYGATETKEDLNKVIDYLSFVGQRPDGQKWRWLAQAVYLARHIQKDNKKALELSYLLAANKAPDLPPWAKQMPVFILQDEGQSDLAYKIMLNILISNIDTMHPNEINYMKDYICNTILKDQPQISPPDFCR